MSIGRTVRTGANVTAMVFFSLILAIMVNYLSFRHYTRQDWTSESRYTLSAATLRVLEELPGEIRVTAFLQPGDEMENIIYESVNELLKNYESASKFIRVEHVDPNRDKARALQLIKKFDISIANVVVFEYGDRFKYVTKNDMGDFEFVPYGAPPKIKSFDAESAFTSAIVNVIEDKQPMIYFSKGHGEPSLDDSEPSGISDLIRHLRRENFNVQVFETLGKERVPEDCDIFAILSPQLPFLESEAKLVADHVQSGGRLLVFLDPVFEKKLAGFKSVGLERTLSELGADPGNDLVVDPAGKLPLFGLQTFLVNRYGAHTITTGMGDVPLILDLPRSITPTGEGRFKGSSLFMTSSEGWAERTTEEITRGEELTFTPGQDLKGPVSIAVAAQDSEGDPRKAGRLVVFGTTSFILNAKLETSVHLDMAVNSIKWLRKKENRIAISPKTPKNTKLTLSGEEMKNLAYLIFIGIPFLSVFVGVMAYLSRRS